MNANGSNKLEDYIKAVDNVDGDVTPFITADKELDTTKVGVQTINVTASDNAGNTTTKHYSLPLVIKKRQLYHIRMVIMLL